jgi:two-component system, chemotaxis family, sensor kinase Cph1
MGRSAISKRRVRLEDLVKEARKEVAVNGSDAKVAWTIHPLPEVEGDAAMLHLVFVNLIGNAVKYARPGERPSVEIGAEDAGAEETVVFVRDQGVGFDMQYAHKLFGVFQRLHSSDQFDGTGIGLANVRRIIHRHGGRTWAEGTVNAGATFYFSLPKGASLS